MNYFLNITEILLKVALNTIILTLPHTHMVRKPKSRCFSRLCTGFYCPKCSPPTTPALIIFCSFSSFTNDCQNVYTWTILKTTLYKNY